MAAEARGVVKPEMTSIPQADKAAEKAWQSAHAQLSKDVSHILISLVNGCESMAAGQEMVAVCAGVASMLTSDESMLQTLLRLGLVDSGDRIPSSKEENKRRSKVQVRPGQNELVLLGPASVDVHTRIRLR